MAKLHYLTVQDVLWINLQVTKKVNRYQYATLEEATFYQYAYGDSDELHAQAARLLVGFLKQAPLSAGNEATAFVACAAFLAMNGYVLSIDDAGALELYRKAAAGSSKDELGRATEHVHGHHSSANLVRDVVTDILERYPRTVSELSGVPVAVVVDGAIH